MEKYNYEDSGLAEFNVVLRNIDLTAFWRIAQVVVITETLSLREKKVLIKKLVDGSQPKNNRKKFTRTLKFDIDRWFLDLFVQREAS